MAGLAEYKVDWTTIYDTGRLLDGFEPGGGGGGGDDDTAAAASPGGGATFLVDVGGGHGVDVRRVLARHPDLPAGSLVLQDLPGVVATAEVDGRVRLMAHDFFRPQPVEGGSVFFSSLFFFFFFAVVAGCALRCSAVLCCVDTDFTMPSFSPSFIFFRPPPLPLPCRLPKKHAFDLHHINSTSYLS